MITFERVYGGTNYERMSYFNELLVKLDQIKLGLLYGRLTENEKKLANKAVKFVDKSLQKDYSLSNRNTQQRKHNANRYNEYYARR